MPPYNEVNLSLRLGKSRKALPQPPAPQPAQQNLQWPDSLKEFVNTSFVRAAHLSSTQNFEFQSQMEKLVEQAISLNKLWENDWLAQKIPALDGGNLELECLQKKRYMENNDDNSFDSDERKRQRQSRFSQDRPRSPSSFSQQSFNEFSGNSASIQVSKKASKRALQSFVGCSQALEKNYLRLTTEPDPLMVRPQKVLEKSMEYVLRRFRTEKKDYSYINNQFKSIRQDLTVQHIKNDFAVAVYETHARIALENNDLGEFNQCQSQLSYLIRDQKRSGGLLAKSHQLELEFTCYRIIYMVMTGNHSDINKLRCEWGNEDAFIQHAFDLQQCQLIGNYHQFFVIYDIFCSQMPLARKLIQQHLLAKERIRALNTMSRAYRRLPMNFLNEELKFGSTEDTLNEFLTTYKLTDFVTGGDLDMALARDRINGIVVTTGFRKIDIKGQI